MKLEDVKKSLYVKGTGEYSWLKKGKIFSWSDDYEQARLVVLETTNNYKYQTGNVRYIMIADLELWVEKKKVSLGEQSIPEEMMEKLTEKLKPFTQGIEIPLSASILPINMGEDFFKEAEPFIKLGKLIKEHRQKLLNQKLERSNEEAAKMLKKGSSKVTDLNDYQVKAMRTAVDKGHDLLNAALGLTGEVGEVVDIIKKHKFQGHELDREDMINELGDVLWYLTLTAEMIDVGLATVATKNIEKLLKRYPERYSDEQSRNRTA